MKHKKFTMIVALVLVVALAAGLGIWATGEEKLPTVTYYDGNDGNNARFVFTNTGKGSATDLFANFSNCMPGDSLTQTICVKADSANGAQGAKVYLRAEIDGDTSAKEGTAIKYDASSCVAGCSKPSRRACSAWRGITAKQLSMNWRYLAKVVPLRMRSPP